MLFPKLALKNLSIGSGSIIGKDNIEEFFNHVSKHEDIEDKSIAEIATNYEIAAASLVHMLEARFVSLNPMMQILFLKLKEENNAKKREFILETLLKEFHEFKIPIPFKLVGMHEAFEKNFDWIVPENPFDESSKPMRDEKGSSKTHLDEIPLIVKDFASIDLTSSFENT